MKTVWFRRDRLLRAHKPGRHGMMVIVALVCLLVVMSIVGSMLKNAIFTRRELLTERDRRQSELLLQAGANRAAIRLNADPSFQGDTWDLPAAAIASSGNGRVVTAVTRSEDSRTWDIAVIAEYPLGAISPSGARTHFVSHRPFLNSQEHSSCTNTRRPAVSR